MAIVLPHVLIYNGLLLLALITLMRNNPRFMLRDYPPAIQNVVPKQTDREQKGALIWGLPFLLVLLLYPFAFGLYGRFTMGLNAIDNGLVIFALIVSFNVVDLLIVDWLVFCTITPRFIVLPGSEGHPAYKDYWFHAMAFVKGMGFSIVVSIVYTAMIEGLHRISDVIW